MPDTKSLKQNIENIVREYGPGQLNEFIKILEEAMIRMAIEDGKTYNAATEILGISKSTMYRKMREYGIPKKRQNNLAQSGERNAS